MFELLKHLSCVLFSTLFFIVVYFFQIQLYSLFFLYADTSKKEMNASFEAKEGGAMFFFPGQDP